MATKPTETLNFEPSGSSVEPLPTAKQAVGFLPAEKLPAQYLSWLFRTFSRLYNYVKDGQFSGPHSITGTFDVTGNTTVTGTLGVSDTLTLAANKNVVLSGTGKVVDAYERTERFHASAFAWGNTGSVVLSLDGLVFGPASNTGGAQYNITLPSGSTIKEFGLFIADNVSGTCIVAARLNRVLLVGSTWVSGTLDTSGNSNGTGNAQTLAVSGLSRVVSSSEFYAITPLVQSGAGTAKLIGGYFKWVP